MLTMTMTKHRSIGITTSMIGPLLLSLILILILLVSTAAAYQPSQQQNQQQRGGAAVTTAGTKNRRREYLAGLVLTATTITVAWTTGLQPANAVLGAGACASGVGEGCGDRSGGNDYIRSLQEKSAVNKDMYERQTREAYYMKNYPDFFAAVGKTLVKKRDGTFLMVDDVALQELKRDDKLTVEIPKTMGGRITDLTQKPVLIMRE